MSGLVLSLRTEPDERLDLSGLLPERLAGMSLDEIGRIPVGTTKRGPAAGDVFAISGTPGGTLRFEGGSARLDRIGEGMTGGAIAVEGDVGHRLGRAMRGGRIDVSGSVADLAGSGMSGGALRIEGDAGDCLGGPLAGETTGMTGGAIRVGGRAGTRAGDRMRRGTILVRGEAGADAGCRMVAGTLIVGGRAAGVPGRLMKRGTILLCAGAARLAPTFLDNGPADLVILSLMARELAGPLGPLPFVGQPMRRLGGDTAVLGLGEIFLPL